MKSKLLRTLTALTLAFGLQPSAFGQGTAFTYQGRLDYGGVPASGIYDLRFAVNDSLNGGNVRGLLTNSAVAVSNGLFTTTLDFGLGVFNGGPRWLELAVRSNGSAAAFTPLNPRQAITATPYAIQAANAGTAANASSVLGLAVNTNLSSVTLGTGNTASAAFATVSGGTANNASAAYATVSGGTDNTASGERATVGGGYFNMASGDRSVVAGGYGNEASGYTAFVGGGLGNILAGWLVDRIYRAGRWTLSRRLPAMVGFVLAAVGLIASRQVNTPGLEIGCLALAIFGADMTLPPSWSLCVDIGRKHSGAVSGTMNMAGNLGSFLTALAFPYLLQWTGGPTAFFYIGATLNLTAVGLWFLTRPDQKLEAW
jgi:hypothetical protein